MFGQGRGPRFEIPKPDFTSGGKGSRPNIPNIPRPRNVPNMPAPRDPPPPKADASGDCTIS